MNLARISLKEPYAVVVIALAVMVIGVTVVMRIPADILPIFKTPAVQILTLYPGMPAEVVEKDMTNRIERWTSQANGIARQESKSITGVSIVRDFFRPDIDANTALSQTSSLAISDLYYLPPGTIPPMVMPYDPTATTPLALLAVSSDTMGESDVYDVAYFNIRNMLSGIKGVIAPAVYGGKLRRILVYVDPAKLVSRGLSPMDVVQALRKFNVFIPTGNAKFGTLDYQINANGLVPTVTEINEFPIKQVNGKYVLVKDIGVAKDTSAIQTNVVHINGKRQVYIPIYRQPGANTIEVVDGVNAAMKRIASRIPKEIKLNLIMDQSHYVREAIHSLIQEGLLGAGLAALMILVFLGSFRSTLVISLSIPLSVLAAFIGLYFTGHTINVMTLGGLALAVGRLVDDAIVVLENIARHLTMGKSVMKAAIEGTQEVAAPVLLATITTIVVFFPVIFLSGMGQFLFVPLALAVAFSMAASFIMSVTVVPVACANIFSKKQLADLSAHEDGGHGYRKGPLGILDRIPVLYEHLLRASLRVKPLILIVSLTAFVASLGLYPVLGKQLFPQSDSGQFMVRLRAPSGTRIEETEKIVAQVEEDITKAIPESDREMVISNTGILYDWPAAYTPNSGPQDSFVLIQLSAKRSSSIFDYVRKLRDSLPQRFPGVEFSFDTGGMLTAALNFGLPSPINVQVEGNDLKVSMQIAQQILAKAKQIEGVADARIQQKLDYPQIDVSIDRLKAAALGLTAEDVVKNIVTSFNSSINFEPAFWVDNSNGNHYFLGAQYPEELIRSFETLKDIPITSAMQKAPVLLRNIATFTKTLAPLEVNHMNIVRVVDVFADVDGRDIGSVSSEIEREMKTIELPKGYSVYLRGEFASMTESFQSLAYGLLLAVILIYLVMVAQFRSFVDPFLIMLAVPLGLSGVLVALFVTDTTINVQSMIGTLFMVGIVVSNSILLVEFANRKLRQGDSPEEAIVEAGRVRLRPILMTSLAAILGLLPMAIGIGRGAEANIPLARAVIGGLLVSTIMTLLVVPAFYIYLKRFLAGRKPILASLEAGTEAEDRE
ncbi:MAG: efflux RND transporter permease subunit [Candidatus Melainabacteria bacterium]|jgi:CzcA family heavy metal efflux pump|nr:efflux RND transporter permease subunit [Candidatus Melainabacteria bacterium]